MSNYSATNIRNLSAYDFDNEVVDMGIPGHLDILGLSSFMAHRGIQSTPFKNEDVYIVSKANLARWMVSVVNKIIELEQTRVSLSLGTFSFQGSDLVNGVLPFSSLSGMSRPPLTAGQFIVFRSGFPLASADPYSKGDGTAVLIPGTGIRFTEDWESDEEGVLWVFTGRTGEMIKKYSFYASSFEGSGNRTITLSALGTDLEGNSINPLPATSANILVFDQGLKTEGVSYNVSGFPSAPVITLLYDALDDQVFHFLVLR